MYIKKIINFIISSVRFPAFVACYISGGKKTSTTSHNCRFNVQEKKTKQNKTDNEHESFLRLMLIRTFIISITFWGNI